MIKKLQFRIFLLYLATAAALYVFINSIQDAYNYNFWASLFGLIGLIIVNLIRFFKLKNQ